MRNIDKLFHRFAFLTALSLLSGTEGIAQTPDSMDVLRRAASAEASFLRKWRDAWAQSEQSRHPVNATFLGLFDKRYETGDGIEFRQHRRAISPNPLDTSMSARHRPVNRAEVVAGCWSARSIDERRTYDSAFVRHGEFASIVRGAGWSVNSQVALGFAVCPTWYLGPGQMPPWDERVTIDAALTIEHRGSIRRARAQLLQTLDSLNSLLPTNDWLVGQRVRFLLDQQSYDGALMVTASCKGSPWWCTLLEGMTRHHRNEPLQALALFERADSILPREAMCEWRNLRTILDDDFTHEYQRLSCIERDSLNRVIWWLADPFWSKAGNERKAEHYARRMALLLRTALPIDERFDTRPEAGGDARAEMILRYGWPAFTFWGGLSVDSLREYLDSTSSIFKGPYVSYEYGHGRVHAVPAGRAIRNPWQAQDTDWSLHTPPGTDTTIHFEFPDYGRDQFSRNPPGLVHYTWKQHYNAYVRNTLWWPREHYAASSPVRQLPVGQRAVLRRSSHARLAMAFPLDSARGLATGRVVDSIFVLHSPGPDSIVTLAIVGGVVGKHIVVEVDIPSSRAMIGVEFGGKNGWPGGRTRFGIIPPLSASAMRPQETDVSQPVLLTDEFAQLSVRNNADALRYMSPRLEVKRGAKLGLYWETYGLVETDSVQFSVRIQPIDQERGLNRFAAWLSLNRGRNTAVTVRWTEMGTGNAHIIETGLTPTVARTLLVDTVQLPIGSYLAELIAVAPGRPPARSEMKFVVR